MTDAFGIVVPVHDEEGHLDTCLAALARAANHPAVAAVPVLVEIVLDRCSDRSADIAARWQAAFATAGPLGACPPLDGPLGPCPPLAGPLGPAPRQLHVVELSAGSVGAARAAGCAAILGDAAGLDPARVWLATTDADSVVPPHWLAHQVALHRAGAQAWAGTVSVDDWSGQPAAAARWFAAHYRAEPGHGHVHGANFGVAGSAYTAGGGFPDLSCSEDVALRDALVGVGVPVLAGTGAPVVTSARREGRAPDGFAAAIRALGAWSGRRTTAGRRPDAPGYPSVTLGINQGVSGKAFPPPSEVLGITVEDAGARLVYYLSGELDALNAGRLRTLLVDQGHDDRHMVIDLSELRFIDSAGLGVLVGALKRFQAAGQGLSLRAPRPSVRRVLDMTGLTTAFSVED